MNAKIIKAGILGVSGYSGLQCCELLLKHPNVRVTYTSANNTQGKLSEIWPRLNGQTNLTCEKFDLKKATELCDLFFLAVPHTTSMEITPHLLKAKKKVIDLSADYRLESNQDYLDCYKKAHSDLANLKQAVYGLTELNRVDIKKAQLVANPGCYPTAALLALAPLVSTQSKNILSIIIDAKSGVSGAGRKALPNLMFSEVNENFKAYKVLNHQHTPEINLHLSKLSGSPIKVAFVPHLLPVNKGILETIYVQLKEKISENKIFELYKKFYKTERFVRLLELGHQPELKDVVDTNYCDIGLTVSREQNLLVVTSVIDNLLKGAAGQAVQNMNIMYQFDESAGLL